MADQPTIRYVNLIGGLATTKHPTVIGPDQCPSILNFQFDGGLPAKRRGWVKILAASLKDACLDFGGAGASAAYAHSPHCGTDLDIGDSFTVEVAVERTPNDIPTPTWEPVIGKGRPYESNANGGWGLGFNSDSIPRFVYIKAGGGQQIFSFGDPVGFGVTKRLSVRRGSTSMVAYIDGVRTASGTVAAAAVATNKEPLLLGSSNGAAVNHFWGKIQDVRVWKTARSDASIAANDDKELAASDTTQLKAYWKLNTARGCYDTNQVASGERMYRSPSPPVWVDGLIQGTPAGTQQSGHRDHALEFDGYEDYLKIPTPTDDPFDFFRGSATGIKTWTVETRVKPRCVPGASESIDTILMYGTVAKPAFHLYESNGKYAGKVEDSAGTEFTVVSTTAAVAGTKAHLALSRSSTQLRLVVDGTQEAITTITGNRFGASVGAVALYVGSRAATVRGTNGHGFVGVIDETRFWKAYRSPALLNKYKADDLPDVTDPDLMLYYKYNEGRGTEIRDWSRSRANGQLYPAATPPVWNSGLVTPNSPPTVDAVFDYQKRGGVVV